MLGCGLADVNGVGSLLGSGSADDVESAPAWCGSEDDMSSDVGLSRRASEEKATFFGVVMMGEMAAGGFARKSECPSVGLAGQVLLLRLRSLELGAPRVCERLRFESEAPR